MKYTKLSLAYLKDNFFIYAILSLIPAIVLGVYTKPFNTALFWVKYSDYKIDNFGDMLALVLNAKAFVQAYPFIVALLSVLFCSSMFFNVMEQHLKIGKLSLANPLFGVNYTAIPVFVTVFVLGIVVLLLKILVASLSYFVHEMFFDPQSIVISNIIIAIMSVSLVFLIIALFLSMLLWIPGIIMSGYKFVDMVVYCLRLIQDNFMQLYSGLVFPLIFTMIVCITISMLTSSVSIIVFSNIIIYLFWIMYIQSYSMLSYFDLTKVERNDKVLKT
ncbi:MAG: hypothetical protein FWF56_06400 [Firmicutes bacterium]|nr:hypothetical protein [Bacillota bacterium]